MSNKTISLVLGGGGARGYAHIGVIDVLHERGFKIDSIAGCSMGAVIGGIYAMDKLDTFRAWAGALRRRDVLRLIDFSLGQNGLIKGDRIIGVLKEMIGDAAIEDLSIRYTAVATDLAARKEVWISQGALFDAIRASIAIPTIFTPVSFRGRLLVDGGLTNPVPIAPTLRDHTDLIIGVNLNGQYDPRLRREARQAKKPRGRYQQKLDEFAEGLGWRSSAEEQKVEHSLLDVLSQSIDLMESQVGRFKLAAHRPDVLIEIPGNSAFFYEFFRADELIDIGAQAARRALDRVGLA